jgi:hypothetical protein|tara:strand:+ start:706 stop:966 length:261 start_codon:yes stop_codon:yes gene_type:complete
MADILKVIQYINPDAKCQITDNDVNKIEWLDGTTPISAEDINAKISEYETAEATKKTNDESKEASGKTKLKNLGLTDEEIKALIGK